MNLKDFALPRTRGRGRQPRARANAVNIQRPLMGPPRRPAPRRNSTVTSSSSSHLIWKIHPNQTNNSTIQKSNSSSRSLSSLDAESRVVIALCEGRGEAMYEVGIAAIDVSRPSMILCQISDAQSYVNTLTKINILHPDEILVPTTFVDTSNTNRLIAKVKEHFKETTMTGVPRITFNKTTGMQIIKELCAPEWNSILLMLQHRYYALSAAAALITYAEQVLYIIYANESIKVEYQESEGFAFIDVATAERLELVASTSPTAGKRYTSLFGVLNYCLTRVGTRTLRASILQPPCSVSDIEARLDCVTELKRNPEMMTSSQKILSKLTNIDRLLSLATFLPNQEQNESERQLNYVLTLNTFLELVTPLRDTLKNARHSFFVELRNLLESETFESNRELVQAIIHSDAHHAKGQQGIVQRCFAIKSGVNGLLDLVRKCYSERIDDMREYVQRLGEKYHLSLSVGNNNKKGYHIVLTLNSHQKMSFKKSDLAPKFIQVERLSTSVTMKTMELINLSARIDDILKEILKLSNIMIYGLLVEVRKNVGLFYKLCEDIAKLDMLQSLAQASSLNYVRPKFGDFLEVAHSRHPMLDFLCPTEPVPNTIFATNEHNVHIITGPNGSGKSIFIRQTVLLQIMAQVGSFVPAHTATFRVCDRILARICFDDNLDCGASTFVLEIKEVQYFQTVMTKNTLIIIDELGRSTSVEEGTSLAMAICEDLAKSSAFIFFTTHFLTATKLEDLYFNIKNWQLETMEQRTTEGRRTINYTYNLMPGVTSSQMYGLYCARSSWPEEIVREAEEILERTWQVRAPTDASKVSPKARLKYELEAELKFLKMKKELTPHALNDKLQQYIRGMSHLGLSLEIVPASFSRCSANGGSGNSEGIFSQSARPSGHPEHINYHYVNDSRRNQMYSQGNVNNLLFTPPGSKETSLAMNTQEERDVAKICNESIMNSTYIAPEAVYSDSFRSEPNFPEADLLSLYPTNKVVHSFGDFGSNVNHGIENLRETEYVSDQLSRDFRSDFNPEAEYIRNELPHESRTFGPNFSPETELPQGSRIFRPNCIPEAEYARDELLHGSRTSGSNLIPEIEQTRDELPQGSRTFGSNCIPETETTRDDLPRDSRTFGLNSIPETEYKRDQQLLRSHTDLGTNFNADTEYQINQNLQSYRNSRIDFNQEPEYPTDTLLRRSGDFGPRTSPNVSRFTDSRETHPINYLQRFSAERNLVNGGRYEEILQNSSGSWRQEQKVYQHETDEMILRNFSRVSVTGNVGSSGRNGIGSNTLQKFSDWCTPTEDDFAEDDLQNSINFILTGSSNRIPMPNQSSCIGNKFSQRLETSGTPKEREANPKNFDVNISLLSINERQFSLPLLRNVERTSTPIQRFLTPLRSVYQEQGKTVHEGNSARKCEAKKENQQTQRAATSRSDSDSIIWKPKPGNGNSNSEQQKSHDSTLLDQKAATSHSKSDTDSIPWKLRQSGKVITLNLTSNSSAEQQNLRVSANIQLSESDIKSAIEDLESCSEYFTDSPNGQWPWTSHNQDLSERFGEEKCADSDVSAAIEDLQNCSEYFSQDWESLDDTNQGLGNFEPKNVKPNASIELNCNIREPMRKPKAENYKDRLREHSQEKNFGEASKGNEDKIKTGKAQIHSVHVFDANCRLVEKIVPNEKNANDQKRKAGNIFGAGKSVMKQNCGSEPFESRRQLRALSKKESLSSSLSSYRTCPDGSISQREDVTLQFDDDGEEQSIRIFSSVDSREEIENMEFEFSVEKKNGSFEEQGGNDLKYAQDLIYTSKDEECRSCQSVCEIHEAREREIVSQKEANTELEESVKISDPRYSSEEMQPTTVKMCFGSCEDMRRERAAASNFSQEKARKVNAELEEKKSSDELQHISTPSSVANSKKFLDYSVKSPGYSTQYRLRVTDDKLEEMRKNDGPQQGNVASAGKLQAEQSTEKKSATKGQLLDEKAIHFAENEDMKTTTEEVTKKAVLRKFKGKRAVKIHGNEGYNTFIFKRTERAKKKMTHGQLKNKKEAARNGNEDFLPLYLKEREPNKTATKFRLRFNEDSEENPSESSKCNDSLTSLCLQETVELSSKESKPDAKTQREKKKTTAAQLNEEEIEDKRVGKPEDFTSFHCRKTESKFKPSLLENCEEIIRQYIKTSATQGGKKKADEVELNEEKIKEKVYENNKCSETENNEETAGTDSETRKKLNVDSIDSQKYKQLVETSCDSADACEENAPKSSVAFANESGSRGNISNKSVSTKIVSVHCEEEKKTFFNASNEIVSTEQILYENLSGEPFPQNDFSGATYPHCLHRREEESANQQFLALGESEPATTKQLSTELFAERDHVFEEDALNVGKKKFGIQKKKLGICHRNVNRKTGVLKGHKVLQQRKQRLMKIEEQERQAEEFVVEDNSQCEQGRPQTSAQVNRSDLQQKPRADVFLSQRKVASSNSKIANTSSDSDISRRLKRFRSEYEASENSLDLKKKSLTDVLPFSRKDASSDSIVNNTTSDSDISMRLRRLRPESYESKNASDSRKINSSIDKDVVENSLDTASHSNVSKTVNVSSTANPSKLAKRFRLDASESPRPVLEVSKHNASTGANWRNKSNNGTLDVSGSKVDMSSNISKAVNVASIFRPPKRSLLEAESNPKRIESFNEDIIDSSQILANSLVLVNASSNINASSIYKHLRGESVTSRNSSDEALFHTTQVLVHAPPNLPSNEENLKNNSSSASPGQIDKERSGQKHVEANIFETSDVANLTLDLDKNLSPDIFGSAAGSTPKNAPECIAKYINQFAPKSASESTPKYPSAFSPDSTQKNFPDSIQKYTPDYTVKIAPDSTARNTSTELFQTPQSTTTKQFARGNKRKLKTSANLDYTLKIALDSTPRNMSSDVFETPQSSTTKPIARGKKGKFKSPLKTSTSSPLGPVPEKKVPRKQLPPRFKPPKKLTKRQIEEEFYRQDKEMAENVNEENVEKFRDRIMNRPSVKQLMRQKQIATLHKTSDGVVVVPAPACVKKEKLIPLKRRSSETHFDVTLFSDKNSDKFEEFLQIKLIEERANMFKFDKFRSPVFQPLCDVPFTTRTTPTTFIDPNTLTESQRRGRATEAISVLRSSVNATKNAFLKFSPGSQSSLSEQNIPISFTPEGFYKDNKSDIISIVHKYLD